MGGTGSGDVEDVGEVGALADLAVVGVLELWFVPKR